MREPRNFLLGLAAALFLAACASHPGPGPGMGGGQGPGPSLPPLPGLAREFRGLWVATAYGIDWPSKPGLSAAELAREADRILDLAASLKFNAILFQARPAGDAFYASSIEPWSAGIAGLQGAAPPEGFDPLAYWLAGARSRGLLFFAWINPFRAGLAGQVRHPASPSLARPELVKELGTGLAWLDPGLAEARDYVVQVALDLVRNYAPDGLVIDDYLYPYPSLLGPAESFPDGESYAAYRAGGGGLGLGEWRVENGNLFMRALAARLREAAPDLILGASPFGIYRSGEPPEARGLSGREITGMDALAWSAEGLLDFVSPQLYWPSTALEQSFPLLLAWWKKALEGGRAAPREKGAALWPSLAPASQRLEPGLRAHEALSELMIGRALLEKRGFIFYSARGLLDEGNGIGASLGPALKTAVLPPELGDPPGASGPLGPPGLELGLVVYEEASVRISLLPEPRARFLLLRSLRRGPGGLRWLGELLAPVGELSLALDSAEGRLEALAFQVADARGRLSEPRYLDLTPP